MAGETLGIGTGASIAFATTAFVSEVLSINGSGMSRESIDTTHLGTTLNRTFTPGDLVDRGEFEIELHLDPDEAIPIDQPAEVITVTFSKVPADATAANWVFTGFMTNFDFAIPLEDKMTATATIKVTGAITFNDAA